MPVNNPNTPERRSLLDKLGLSARDAIVIAFILANTILVLSGHNQLEGDVLKMQQASVQIADCRTRSAALPTP